MKLKTAAAALRLQEQQVSDKKMRKEILLYKNGPDGATPEMVRHNFEVRHTGVPKNLKDRLSKINLVNKTNLDLPGNNFESVND